MNTVLIKRWNDKISYDDEVYIFRDFIMKGPDKASVCLPSLRGRKYLVKETMTILWTVLDLNRRCFVLLSYIGMITERA